MAAKVQGQRHCAKIARVENLAGSKGTSWAPRRQLGTFLPSAETTHLGFSSKGHRNELENCAGGPVGARIGPKGFRTNEMHSRRVEYGPEI